MTSFAKCRLSTVQGFGAVLFCVGLLFASERAAAIIDYADLAEENSKAVVSISAVSYGQPSVQDIPEHMKEFLNRFFGHQFPQQEEDHQRGVRVGSGFIIDKKGHIITNAHVVENTDRIVVKLSDDRTVEAELMGLDERSDVALLKIEEKNLHHVKLGNSKKTRVGEPVMAIGGPYGFDYSVTQGVVSAKGRVLRGLHYTPFLQTDAVLNVGSSGGPLFNIRGEVIGVNTRAYTSQTGGFLGISFAIPINLVKKIVAQIEENGLVQYGYLGIHVQDLTHELAKSFDMVSPRGALVTEVIDDTPADKAGLKTGDVVLRIDGDPVEDVSDLLVTIGSTPPETKVKLSILRKGKVIQRTARLDALDEAESGSGASKKSRTASALLGLEVANLSKDDLEKLEIDNGVRITKVEDGGVGSISDLRRGDVVIRFNDSKVDSVRGFSKMIERAPRDVPIQVLLLRNRSLFFTTITIP